MKNCILHSILVHDACGNFEETLTFRNIFSLGCDGYKYVSLEGKVFDTGKHIVRSHIDASGNYYSDPSGNIIYHATRYTDDQLNDSCSLGHGTPCELTPTCCGKDKNGVQFVCKIGYRQTEPHCNCPENCEYTQKDLFEKPFCAELATYKKCKQ